jgi:hypothetical protein
MEPPSKRSRKLEAKANAEASALCVQAPTIDGAILAPDDIQWLETALTKFSDGIADTDVSANTDHHVCQWHHKSLCGQNRRLRVDCRKKRYSDGRCIAHVAWQCVSTHRWTVVKALEARMKKVPGKFATSALIAEARSVVAELNNLKLQTVQEACIVAQEQATALQAAEGEAAALRAAEEEAATLKLKEARENVETAREATNQCKSEAANHLEASLIDSAIPTEALMEVFALAQEAANRQDDDLSPVQATEWLKREFQKVDFIQTMHISEAAVAAATRLWAITRAIFEDKVSALSKQGDAFKVQERKFVDALNALKSEEAAAVGAAKAATAAAETTAAVETKAAAAAKTKAAAFETKAAALETEAAASAETIAKAATVPFLKDLAQLWAAGIIINAVRERGERHTNH